MLVLSRKIDEKIRIGEDVVLTILENKGGRVKIGLEAPTNIRIVRTELDANAPTDPPSVPARCAA